MIIANPIYDVVFKKLMENDKIVKFFIGTLLNENIVEVQVKPQEYTYKGEFAENDPNAIDIIEDRIRKRQLIWVYRLDFIATIKTEDGEYKKVLIEIQKARNLIDLMRFRRYLAEQYWKEDIINNVKTALPITTIYILGFNLPEIDSACVKVDRNYIDLINNITLTKKSDFIEKLTHDSYVVQVERITNRYQTKLDKLLSIFEQNNFEDENKTVKKYTHRTDIEEVKIITDMLHYVGTEPEERKRIENEQEAWRTITAYMDEKEIKIRQFQKEIQEKKFLLEVSQKEIEESRKEIEEKNRVIEEKNKEIEESRKEVEGNREEIEEMKKQIQLLMERIK